uniref:Zinc transporter ZIP11 n=1 Tax=Parascaris univalens TaxID=6257 RepID=A0A915CEU9_PARUN
MIRDKDPILQALVASLFTWGVTALGAAVVFFLPPRSKKLLDVSLGFAAGVMTAASFWSLLAPAIEIAEANMGALAFIPVAVGFAAGSAFVHLADRVMPECVLAEMSVVDLLSDDPTVSVARTSVRSGSKNTTNEEETLMIAGNNAAANARYGSAPDPPSSSSSVRQRLTHKRKLSKDCLPVAELSASGVDGDSTDIVATTISSTEPGARATEKEKALVAAISWRRILLLIIAVTVHNIPEGLAVGVAFGSVGKAARATFESAFNLALGIGLQNFPEGLAVSLPLAAFGHSKFKSFLYGQLSGMVEPIAALGGAAAVILVEPILPYALSFAAGAMIYVVVDDIIPEAQRNGNGRNSTTI